MYYPESDCPYYRCTVFSHYGIGNAPLSHIMLPTVRKADATIAFDKTAKEGPYWSLMFEISENKEFKPVNLATIVEVSCPFITSLLRVQCLIIK
jgi:hypothetical protein